MYIFYELHTYVHSFRELDAFFQKSFGLNSFTYAFHNVVHVALLGRETVNTH